MSLNEFLFCSEQPVEATDSKLMLNEIHIKGQTMDSDEESNVDHFSPQTLLETPDSEMQYSIRSPEGKFSFLVIY